MTKQSTSLLVGLLAGICAALLLVSPGSPSSLSFILFAAAALPVLIAGLGWSNLASIVAVLSAMAVIAIATTPQAALVSAVTTLSPAAWIAHLSNLARPADEVGGPQGAIVWYPLSDIFMNLAFCVCIGLVAIGLAMGYGEGFVDELVNLFVSTIKESNPAYQPSAEGLAEMKQFFLYALPTIQAAMWVLILFSAIGMGMMVSATDLMTLYIGLEMSSLSSYVLASFLKEDSRSSEAGLKYFVLGALASGIILYGVSLVYGFTG